MTRKDYVATANILKDYLDELGLETMSDLVEDFSDYFRKQLALREEKYFRSRDKSLLRESERWKWPQASQEVSFHL